ncbi:deoxynucleotide monophosphate kinase family protein [Streptomyces sp. NBC_01768]|uniref:deoxynucleotide monophosphate kinase family protein n=1 Tax=Streptomyces sp. NBC_01768 TaxID=2975938 RepID=UPI002DDBE360|nr:hypothetical protein [Streptomyces sp. NBC_01768]WSC31800.1 hypothetical protein OG902_36705 [Streptomyces sp. NBC_01768]
MHIGLMGYARSGKDTVGAYLTEAHGYRRVSFADPLREAALKLDPIVSAEQDARLSEVIDLEGWESVKDRYPEVRRILQYMGQGVRDLDPDFWIRQALRKVDDAEAIGLPCVITDVRYPNEVEALRRRGFHLVCVQRPGVEPVNGHISETAVTPDDADELLINGGTIDALNTLVERLWEGVHNTASRRHYSRSY